MICRITFWNNRNVFIIRSFRTPDMSGLIDSLHLRMSHDILDQPGLRKKKDQRRGHNSSSNYDYIIKWKQYAKRDVTNSANSRTADIGIWSCDSYDLIVNQTKGPSKQFWPIIDHSWVTQNSQCETDPVHLTHQSPITDSIVLHPRQIYHA
jgi:hypothetical protein